MSQFINIMTMINHAGLYEAGGMSIMAMTTAIAVIVYCGFLAMNLFTDAVKYCAPVLKDNWTSVVEAATALQFAPDHRDLVDVTDELTFVGFEHDVLAMARFAADEAEALIQQVEDRWGQVVPAVRAQYRKLQALKNRVEIATTVAEISLVISKSKLQHWYEREDDRNAPVLGWLSDGREHGLQPAFVWA
jgi:hypothetical protein